MRQWTEGIAKHCSIVVDGKNNWALQLDDAVILTESFVEFASKGTKPLARNALLHLLTILLPIFHFQLRSIATNRHRIVVIWKNYEKVAYKVSWTSSCSYEKIWWRLEFQTSGSGLPHLQFLFRTVEDKSSKIAKFVVCCEKHLLWNLLWTWHETSGAGNYWAMPESHPIFWICAKVITLLLLLNCDSTCHKKAWREWWGLLKISNISWLGGLSSHRITSEGLLQIFSIHSQTRFAKKMRTLDNLPDNT